MAREQRFRLLQKSTFQCGSTSLQHSGEYIREEGTMVWGSFPMGPRRRLMALLAFALVEASGLLS